MKKQSCCEYTLSLKCLIKAVRKYKKVFTIIFVDILKRQTGLTCDSIVAFTEEGLQVVPTQEGLQNSCKLIDLVPCYTRLRQCGSSH